VSYQVPDGGDGLQIWKVAANILNIVADSRQGVVLQLWCWAERLITPHRKKNSTLRNVTPGLGLGQILWNGLSNGK
jgi:hypothetical protein